MRISRAGRTGDFFAEQLKDKLAKKMPGSDQHIDDRLDEQRDLRGHEHKLGTEEVILTDDRKNDATIGQKLTEKNLRERGDEKAQEKVTEKQLDDAQENGNYPHRNEAAYERTGDKRQVNALDEELGDAGDASKEARYDQAYKSGPKRILDKDVGSQLTNEKTKIKNAYNLKQKRMSQLEKAAGDYLEYRSKEKPYNIRMAEAAGLDDTMAKIMSVAQKEGRNLTDDEKERVASLKMRKSELLRIGGRA